MTVGERLKSTRESRKISLEEACRVTKIQRKTLEAIEQDQVQDILDPAYAKIFLKKYASYLGVDGGTLLQEYQENRPFQPQEPAPLTVETAPSLWVPLAAGLAALVGVAFLVYLSVDLFHNLSKQHSLPRTSSLARTVRLAKIPERPLLVPSSKPLKLTVQTTADVWLQVKADGTVIFQNVLAKGSQESWTAKQDLELWTGNAGAMQLSLNGKPLEGLGRGVKKGVRITHAGIEL